VSLLRHRGSEGKRGRSTPRRNKESSLSIARRGRQTLNAKRIKKKKRGLLRAAFLKKKKTRRRCVVQTNAEITSTVKGRGEPSISPCEREKKSSLHYTLARDHEKRKKALVDELPCCPAKREKKRERSLFRSCSWIRS